MANLIAPLSTTKHHCHNLLLLGLDKDSLDEKPTPNAEDRIVCGSAAAIEHGGSAESETGEGINISYHVVSQPQVCYAGEAKPDRFGWVHDWKLRDKQETVLGIASVITDEQRGCLFVTGMRDTEQANEEVDEAIICAMVTITLSIR